jgi:sec-independent protein translocase protein TatA
MGELRPWHIAVLVVVVVILFGAKRLPTAARSLGQSMRILKAETQGLRDDNAATTTPAAAPALDHHTVSSTQPSTYTDAARSEPIANSPR